LLHRALRHPFRASLLASEFATATGSLSGTTCAPKAAILLSLPLDRQKCQQSQRGIIITPFTRSASTSKVQKLSMRIIFTWVQINKVTLGRKLGKFKVINWQVRHGRQRVQGAWMDRKCSVAATCVVYGGGLGSCIAGKEDGP
jgi:hypothetical protein